MIDAHNHLQKFADPESIISQMKAVGIGGCIVNGTSERDWQQVADLAKRFPEFIYPAYGLHPWFVADRSADWLETLQTFLDQTPNSSIGECGLDGWKKGDTMRAQQEVFQAHLRLARERSLAITVHALKAWGPLLESLGKEPPSATGFLLHSFGGSPELVTQLAPLGAHFSFSGYFLHSQKSSVIEAYREVPSDRLMVETDAPEMSPPESAISHPLPDDRNHPGNLAAITAALANQLGESPIVLTKNTTTNTRRFFSFC